MTKMIALTLAPVLAVALVWYTVVEPFVSSIQQVLGGL